MKKVFLSIINSLVVKSILFVVLTSSVSVYFNNELQKEITFPIWVFILLLLLSSVITCLIIYVIYITIRKKDVATIYQSGMMVYHTQGRFPMVVIQRNFWKRNTIIVDAFVHGKGTTPIRMNVRVKQIMIFTHTA